MDLTSVVVHHNNSWASETLGTGSRGRNLIGFIVASQMVFESSFDWRALSYSSERKRRASTEAASIQKQLLLVSER